jgi:hypothetical protein
MACTFGCVLFWWAGIPMAAAMLRWDSLLEDVGAFNPFYVIIGWGATQERYGFDLGDIGVPTLLLLLLEAVAVVLFSVLFLARFPKAVRKA